MNEALALLSERMGVEPRIGLVLGSGWGDLLGTVEDVVRVPYGDVPGMRVSTVAGHAGEWLFGRLAGKPVAIMSGRLHYYEGHSLQDVVYPIRLMKRLGVETLVLTNAAGAVNEGFAPGDLMLVSDHLNLTGANPLFGPNDDAFGPRFPDMTYAYDPALRAVARSVAHRQGLPLREGVYAFMTGPCYETPAEIRMLRTMGADAVGMSTVPETIAAVHAGLKVLALSCMTNMAAGILETPLSHRDVLETAERVRGPFTRYLTALVETL